MYLVIVLDITKEDGPSVFAACAEVVERCMTIETAEWKAQEATDCAAVFKGTALQRLSVCSSLLYTSEATKGRVRSIDYRTARVQPMQFPGGGHKPGQR
jgi:hypothetical protein